jgi:ADP-ribosylglycohydrolase
VLHSCSTCQQPEVKEMIEKARAMVLASFVADSFALGAHWMYDTSEIERRFGRVQDLLKPEKSSYHVSKDLGEFTHYGDQTLVLLESVATCSRFDLEHFARSWRALFDTYKGYFDKATKGTIKNLAGGNPPTGSGSASTDLAGAARIAPLVYRYRHHPEELVAAVRAQTIMTHNNPLVVASAEFFARVTYKVLLGSGPTSAVEAVRQESFADSPLTGWVAKGLEGADKGSRDAIAAHGQSCNARGAFPAVIHLIARHERDLREAFIENVMAGGDSAARGMIVGMVLGAHLGLDGMPVEWLSGLKHLQHIVDLLDSIDEQS